MNVRIITASAGSGKTFRLTQELDAAIAARRARPEGIVAATFTTHAAVELIERARARLLMGGRAREAQQLLAARIGTVHAVCGMLVEEFAFELGLSPAVRVLDDAAAELELRRALARVVTEARASELERLRARFEPERDWRGEVRRIVEAARTNGLGGAALGACAERSIRELDACLGAEAAGDLDGELARAMAGALAAIEVCADATQATAEYAARVGGYAAELSRSRELPWGAWAWLAKRGPAKRSAACALAVQEAARRHPAHPRLRAELRALIAILFETAAQGLEAYQAHKRAHGAVDFVDLEALALELLRRADVRAALAGQIDLFLVDELQDTSPIQLAVFLELARLATASIWVGDPKQAIYEFRGTDPALVDAAAESLAEHAAEPWLGEQAARAIAGPRIEALGTSYRSRPALVGVTSEIFARAFAHQGIPEERTRLAAADVAEPAGLGEILEHWPLDVDRARGTDNEAGRAAAVAAGVRALLGRAPAVRARGGAPGAIRAACRGDVAVLCRTNSQCQAVADALGALGVAAVVPRVALLATAEGQAARAGLALWVDPRDGLAAAELARLVAYPADLDAFVARALEAPRGAAFHGEPCVARVLAAREAARDLGPVAAVDAVIAATGLRELCAGWGDAAQRLGNLDALRAHATVYARGAGAGAGPGGGGSAPTIAGLVAYLDGLTAVGGTWQRVRADRQAVLVGEDAVTVSTWHRAKGLEWPIVVLFGLERVREPVSYGVHVLCDRGELDLADPLGGRWIRCWPNPYGTANQGGAVRDAIEATAAHAALVGRAEREALRLLYVGWTRARDRLVIAARRGQLLGGVFGTLAALDPALAPSPLDEPAVAVAASGGGGGVARVRWAGVEVSVRVAPCEPAPPARLPPEPGTVTIGREHAPYVPARRAPSAAPPVSCALGEVVALGPRLRIRGVPQMEAIGDAIHGFLAIDRPEPAGAPAHDTAAASAERLALAQDLLAAYGVAEHVVAADVVAAGSRLWAWIAARFRGARIYREWPISHRVASGTLVAGTADLVLVGDLGVVVIDHKTFPGAADAAAERALGYSGQLAAYAAALRAATGAPIASTWIHFPVRGRLVEVRLLDAGEEDSWSA
ncbi:MAG TPA: UvrD-helicase domain-containing protein [Kofleriaceae bacterium]|nr:UvrD-helicase domain-containing protein [Kofleriaceae bacterium]